jgi:hypothetical protein
VDLIGKPLDVGGGRVCASFDPVTAGWLSIGSTHPHAGFVELNALPPFDERGRGDPTATRRHRASMTDAAHAFLSVQIDGRVPALHPNTEDPDVPRWVGDGVRAEAWAPADAAHLIQRWHMEDGPADVTLHLRGRIDRPALAEITELDPPLPTGATTVLAAEGGRVLLSAPALPAVASVSCHGASVSWRAVGDGFVAQATTRDLEIAIALTAEPDVAAPPPAEPPPPASPQPDRLTARALAYVRGCAALRFDDDERAILTDHRILPLSWTRDAYWQALALLAADGRGDRRRVADHLRWLWRRCERPDGRWVRSHHADGRRKDLAFQADQQLYPIIELADYWRLAAALPDGVSWPRAVAAAWSVIDDELDRGDGLLASDENAADDPVAAPFIGASQILAWYAAERLAEMTDALGLLPPAAALHACAASVRAAFARHHAGGSGPWAYATDGHGSRVDYHDANDLPVALAPLWGFCAASDPGWRATLRFAFAPSNPAWVDGRRPGLGSVHTPGPWTLGDIQAWIVGRAAGRPADMEAAMRRLDEVAFGDGMLPEAYEADGEARIRHWFAWPGAAFAALRLLAGQGRLEATVGVRRR